MIEKIPVVYLHTTKRRDLADAMLLKEVLGDNVKLVSGFKGTAEIRLTMKSGEVDSVITGWKPCASAF